MDGKVTRSSSPCGVVVWLCLALLSLVIHAVLLYSIFDIYYSSPLIPNLQPHPIVPHRPPLSSSSSSSSSRGAPTQSRSKVVMVEKEQERRRRHNPKETTTPPEDWPAPAKRLVIFSADGLRARSFYSHPERSPNLHKLMGGGAGGGGSKASAAWGISLTQVPTESRPGHVAMMAGFGEDVSAVAAGWRRNPVPFDSTLNRSVASWLWGSPDIVHPLADGVPHAVGECYNAEEEDFASENAATKLDEWVFQRVERFLQRASRRRENEGVEEQAGVIFFLHLLGLDTNGHGQGPNSQLYLENIAVVDAGVGRMHRLFEERFHHDNRTTYLFVADHGMTDWGSHGAGSDDETHTPFVAWGAGVQPHPAKQQIHQIDLAPLQASLLGLPVPMNSHGVLPLHLIRAPSSRYAYQAAAANLRQMLEQYHSLRRERYANALPFTFADSPHLPLVALQRVERELERLVQQGRHEAAAKACIQWVPHVRQALFYFHRYHRRSLGIAIASLFMAWNALIYAAVTHAAIVSAMGIKMFRPSPLSIGLLAVVASLLRYQRLPLSNYCYYLLPIYVAGLAVQIYFSPPVGSANNGEALRLGMAGLRRWLLRLAPSADEGWEKWMASVGKPVFKTILFLVAGSALLCAYMGVFLGWRWLLTLIYTLLPLGWWYFDANISASTTNQVTAAAGSFCPKRQKEDGAPRSSSHHLSKWHLLFFSTSLCLAVFPMLDTVGQNPNRLLVGVAALLYAVLLLLAATLGNSKNTTTTTISDDRPMEKGKGFLSEGCGDLFNPRRAWSWLKSSSWGWSCGTPNSATDPLHRRPLFFLHFIVALIVLLLPILEDEGGGGGGTAKETPQTHPHSDFHQLLLSATRIFAWSTLPLSLAIPILASSSSSFYSSTTKLWSRMWWPARRRRNSMLLPGCNTNLERYQVWAASLAVPYTLMSVSYEGIFLIVYTTFLYAYVKVEELGGAEKGKRTAGATPVVDGGKSPFEFACNGVEWTRRYEKNYHNNQPSTPPLIKRKGHLGNKENTCYYHLYQNAEDNVSPEQTQQKLHLQPLPTSHFTPAEWRRALLLLAFIEMGFFGTGNIASLNSFNPRALQRFISVFSPFVMAALLVWRVAVPFAVMALAVACVVPTGVNVSTADASEKDGEENDGAAKSSISKVFQKDGGGGGESGGQNSSSSSSIFRLSALMLMLTNFMSLTFFFQLRDEGSWLEVGLSISNYVISMFTAVVCFALLHGAAWLIRSL